jgi:hypothetical protein
VADVDDRDPEIAPPPDLETKTPPHVAAPQAVEFRFSNETLSGSSGPRNRSLAFLCSLALHGGVCLVGLGLNFAPAMPAAPVRHYSFRLLRLTPLVYSPRVPGAQNSEGRPDSGVKRPESAEPASAGRDDPYRRPAEPESPENGVKRRLFRLPPDLRVRKAEQTLIQPDVPPQIERTESIRVPDVLIWSPKDPIARPLITPVPAMEAKSLDIPPTLDLPEINAKILERLMPAIPATIEPEILPVRIATSPVRLNTPDPGNQVPETVSRIPSEKSAGHLISVADIPLPPEGLIAIPPLNQVASSRNPESSSAGNNSDHSAGQGGKTGKSAGDGTANAPSASFAVPKSAASTETGAGQAGQPGERGGSVVSTVQGPVEPGVVSSERPGERSALGELTRIQRPTDGRHNSVVLGVSAPESYPESAGVLSGKIVYTVYLQVGLAKSWILQFCLPGAGETAANTGKGRVAALDAPWPFVIVRPASGGLNGDYTLIHGFVNAQGRFEQMALVVPDEAAKKELLGALQQWEFRPASRDGQPTSVEILLIIPHRKN